MSHTPMTRTEMGYAYWKEIPSTVSQARRVAIVNIANKRINERIVESWAKPAVKFLNDVAERMKR